LRQHAPARPTGGTAGRALVTAPALPQIGPGPRIPRPASP